MNRSRLLWLRWPVGIAVSAISLYALSVQTDLGRAMELALRAPAPQMVLAAALILLSVWAKSVRWGLLLGMPGLRISRLMGVSLVGYLFSTFLPFRAGELVRAIALHKVEGVGISRSLASIVLEKVFDVATLLTLLVLVALASPLPPWAAAGSASAGVGLLVLCTLVALAPRIQQLSGKLEGRWPWLGGTVSRWLQEFAEGLGGQIRWTSSLVAIVGWSLVAWGSGMVTLWLGLGAVGILAPLWLAGLILVITNLGMAVPSAPGYVGVYHYLVALCLSAYGIDAERSTAAALVLHLLLFGSLAVFALTAMAALGLGIRQLSSEGRAQER